MKLLVIILTKNEGVHLGRAIESVRRIQMPVEVLVVDSFSDDDTKAIALKCSALFLEHRFINQADQFSWALEQVGAGVDWVMRLDADETVSLDLAAELSSYLPDAPEQVTHVLLKRRHVFMGRVLRHGGRRSIQMLRIWRPGTVVVERRWMDEHIVAQVGLAHTARHPFFDWNLKDLSYFSKKHVDYATREAVEFLVGSQSSRGQGLNPQARVRRMLKYRLYYRLPFPVTSAMYFLLRYVVQLGFLDGKPGLVYHGLQAMWYRFLVGARISELEELTRQCHSRTALVSRLSELTGLAITDGDHY